MPRLASALLRGGSIDDPSDRCRCQCLALLQRCCAPMATKAKLANVDDDLGMGELGALTREGARGMEELPPARVLGELLGLLAHDLRNPLSALHSNLGFLDGSVALTDSEMSEAVQDGLISCESLRHMIDNIDLLSQELRGLLAPAEGALPLGPILGGVLLRCEPIAKSHSVELRLEQQALERSRLQVRGTPDLLARLFTNLLHNSIQHSPSHSEVSISAGSGDQGVWVRIRDAGLTLTGERGQQAFSAAGQSLAKARGGGRYSRAFGLYSASLGARCCGAIIEPLRDATQGGFQVSWRRGA
jgi:K+-sensing histidine kinase KdpD